MTRRGLIIRGVDVEGGFEPHLTSSDFTDVRPARLVERWVVPISPKSFPLQVREAAAAGRGGGWWLKGRECRLRLHG